MAARSVDCRAAEPRERASREGFPGAGREVEIAVGHQGVAAGSEAGLFGRIMGSGRRNRLAVDGTFAATHDGDDEICRSHCQSASRSLSV